jgi:hypothetical protein
MYKRTQRFPSIIIKPSSIFDAFGYVALLIQEKMIVAKMRSRGVPVKVLRLQIQSEHVGKQDIQRARKVPHDIRL